MVVVNAVLLQSDPRAQFLWYLIDWHYEDETRIGDHIWWVSDGTKFLAHYPAWRVERDVPTIIEEIAGAMHARG
jgi:hypothetical protein